MFGTFGAGLCFSAYCFYRASAPTAPDVPFIHRDSTGLRRRGYVQGFPVFRTFFAEIFGVNMMLAESKPPR